MTKTVYGPILAMPGGYGYRTWNKKTGHTQSFVYSRLDYARDALRRESGVKTETVDEFESHIAKAQQGEAHNA